MEVESVRKFDPLILKAMRGIAGSYSQLINDPFRYGIFWKSYGPWNTCFLCLTIANLNDEGELNCRLCPLGPELRGCVRGRGETSFKKMINVIATLYNETTKEISITYAIALRVAAIDRWNYLKTIFDKEAPGWDRGIENASMCIAQK